MATETRLLEKKYILGGPVTAISVLSIDKCLIAKGPYLEVHSLCSASTTRRHLIFSNGVSIHGIRMGRDGVIVLFGGKYIALVDVETLEPLQQTLCLSDWIWDLQIIRGQVLAVGLANNVCELWRMEEGVADRQARWVNDVRCMTYCMTFAPASDDSIITLASGTIFNEVLIWSLDRQIRNNSNAGIMKRTDHKLVGHEGVILGLQFNDEGTLLASTSDDRSVRLSGLDQVQGWTCLWVGWGHTARIWKVVFASEGLVTTGEDGTARLWSIEDGNELAQLRNYSSQSLWCATVWQQCVVFGTNDGSAKIWDLSSTLDSQQESQRRVVRIPDDRPEPRQQETTEEMAPAEEQPSTDDSPTKKKKKNKKPRVLSQVIFGMDFCSSQSGEQVLLFVGTREGTLFSMSTVDLDWTNSTDCWAEGLDRDLFDSSTATCLAISASGLAVVGTTTGYLVLKQLDSSAPSTLIDGRAFKSVQGLNWFTEEMLASFHIQGILVLWRVDCANFTRARTFDTTTGAIPTCLSFLSESSQFVVGDNRGNISLFNNNGDCSETAELACDVAHRVHGKECVNEVLCTAGHHLLSVGNDGCINESFLDADKKLVRGTSVPVSRLSGVSCMWIEESMGTSRTILSGYYGNTYLVIDFTNGCELFRFETEGRQRKLSHFAHLATGRHCAVVCASQKDGTNDLLLRSNLLPENSTEASSAILSSVGTALHGEPVYDACLFTTRDDSGYAALLSGSEDCTERLSFLDSSGVLCSVHLPPQESCVRAVAASRNETSNSTMLTVCGGKLCIDFYVVVDSSDGGSFSHETIHVRQIGRGRIKDKADIDHRINAVQATPVGGSSHLVVTGDSNGAINVFLIQEHREEQRFTLPGTLLTVMDRPVISLDLIRNGTDFFVVVGTTGGHISVWVVMVMLESLEMKLPASMCHSYQAHRMGTNCICSSLLERLDGNRSRILVSSGGDDQSLTIVEMILSSGVPLVTVKSTETVAEADVSALKGVHYIGNHQLVTVGYGQRLLRWKWSRDEAGTRLLESIPADVSDVNSLAYCKVGNETLIAVGGEGLELISMA